MRAKKLTSKKLIGDFITLKQLLQSVPLSDRTIRKYIDGGKLRAYKLDGMLVFNVLDIQAFLKRRSVGGGATAPIIKDTSENGPILQWSQQMEQRLLALVRLTPEQAGIVSRARVFTDEESREFFANAIRYDEDGPYDFPSASYRPGIARIAAQKDSGLVARYRGRAVVKQNQRR
jgi:hypothetical protein